MIDILKLLNHLKEVKQEYEEELTGCCTTEYKKYIEGHLSMIDIIIDYIESSMSFIDYEKLSREDTCGHVERD